MTSTVNNTTSSELLNRERSDRRMAEVRHGGWMLQLERALLAFDQDARKGNVERGTEDTRQSRDAKSDATAPRGSTSEQSMSHQTLSIAQAPRASDMNRMAMQSQQGTSQQRAASFATDDGKPTFDGTSEVTAGHCFLSPSIDGSNDGTAGALSMAVNMQQLEAGGYGMALTGEVAGSRSVMGHAFILQQADMVAVPPVLQPVSPFSNAAEPATSVLTQSETEVTAPHATDVPAAPVVAAEDGQFSRKAMHVFYGEAGVQAWIRDRDIGLDQAAAIAGALYAELADAGYKLNALTVNGKRVSASVSSDGEALLETPSSSEGGTTRETGNAARPPSAVRKES